MAMTPESLPENAIIDFRAPPPSPVASGRRSSVRNEDVLSEFLEHSLKVPDLVLPDRVFPRQKSIQDPPKLDLQFLTSLENESFLKLIDSIARVGCFEVVNHGIPHDLIESVLLAGDGIFGISPEKRKLATRSLARPFGFDEVHEEEEEEEVEEERVISEEFIWCPDEGLKTDMEGIWPTGYSSFSDKMEKLLLGIEDVAEKILVFLQQQNCLRAICEYKTEDREFGSSICYLQKHCRVITEDQSLNSLRYDMIRMLIRGSEFPHALCLHVCNGAEEFHVYSKKGWVSFHPGKDSFVITIGDKLETGSDGQYKHVIGKPIFTDVHHNSISMAFLYSPRDITAGGRNHKGRNISISQQIIVAIIFSLLYQLMVCVYESL